VYGSCHINEHRQQGWKWLQFFDCAVLAVRPRAVVTERACTGYRWWKEWWCALSEVLTLDQGTTKEKSRPHTRLPAHLHSNRLLRIPGGSWATLGVWEESVLLLLLLLASTTSHNGSKQPWSHL